jgi:hypothetical protein
MTSPGDNRIVVLLKSLTTNNRFYTLVPPDGELQNGDVIAEFPDHLPLGIAYPCLEDGLNDFAVIRTTFETLDLFPDDQELRREMMDIINDARNSLKRRLVELRDKLESGQAHFLGTDLNEFKEAIVHLATKGNIRKTLDNMMKLDVFESVAAVEAAEAGAMPEPVYRFELLPQYALDVLMPKPGREFVSRVFDDVLTAVEDDGNYLSKYTFDKHVFQKFIAVMFVNYATTDPMFYGTNKADYGVSSDKEMQNTPLYRAVAVALRELEEEHRAARPVPSAPEAARPVPSASKAPAAVPPATREPAPIETAVPPLEDRLAAAPGSFPMQPPSGVPAGAESPAWAHAEQTLMEPFISIAEAMQLLRRMEHPRARECGEIIGLNTRRLFRQLKTLGLISPVVADPLDHLDDLHGEGD